MGSERKGCKDSKVLACASGKTVAIIWKGLVFGLGLVKFEMSSGHPSEGAKNEVFGT